MRRFIFLFIVCAFLFLSCGVVRVTGEFDSKYEFFLKTKLYPKFFFTDTIGMRDYKDLSIIEREQYDIYCRARFKDCDLADNNPASNSR